MYVYIPDFGRYYRRLLTVHFPTDFPRSSLPQEFSAKTTGNFETILGGYATQTAADRNLT